MPETVKYGISNLTLMGGRVCVSWSRRGLHQLAEKIDWIDTQLPGRTDGRPKWARIMKSRAPPSCLIFHTNADLSGAY
jgi:hypothetical protein